MAAIRTAAQGLEGPLTLATAGLRALLAEMPCPTEILEETPGRVVRALCEMTRGYREDPAEILARQFPATSDDLVILKDIEFTSLCEHHLMPFAGHAHVGYLPNGFAVGLSKLARVVDCYAARLQMQERLCAEIARAIETYVSSFGAACVIEATHGCLCYRGAQKTRATFITSTMLGRFREDLALRQEFFDAIKLTHSKV